MKGVGKSGKNKTEGNGSCLLCMWRCGGEMVGASDIWSDFWMGDVHKNSLCFMARLVWSLYYNFIVIQIASLEKKLKFFSSTMSFSFEVHKCVHLHGKKKFQGTLWIPCRDSRDASTYSHSMLQRPVLCVTASDIMSDTLPPHWWDGCSRLAIFFFKMKVSLNPRLFNLQPSCTSLSKKKSNFDGLNFAPDSLYQNYILWRYHVTGCSCYTPPPPPLLSPLWFGVWQEDHQGYSCSDFTFQNPPKNTYRYKLFFFQL